MTDHAAIIHKVGQPLPVAVKSSREELSPALVQEINALGRPEAWRFVGTAIVVWLSVAAAIWVAVAVAASDIPLLFKILWYLLTVIFIGTRQNNLAVLVHEQVHRSGLKGTVGDYIANALTAFWIGITVEGYRKVHLAHHAHFFTDKDPDFRRKQGVEWEFPQPASLFLKTLLRDLMGLSVVRTLKSKDMKDGEPQKKDRNASLFKLGFYLTLAIVLTLTGTWSIFLLYWLLPLLTVMQFIVRWWSICEHRYNLINPSMGEATPFIMLSWWERLLLPMYNFNYHSYHHLFPYIGAPDLPKIHRIFQREGLVEEKHIFRGYADYIRFLFRSPSPV